MVAWESGMPIGPNIFMAMEVFVCDMLRILTSDLDKSQEQTRLGIKVSCCASGMSVVIMSAEPSVDLGFVI
jgi:hypothetical protein